VGEYTSIALGASGHPHISYYDVSNSNLKYAQYDGTSWQIEIVDSEGEVGKYTSIAVDGSGRPHISYFDNTNDDLKYAYKDGDSWHTETVDSAPYVGWETSIAIGPFGCVHISYFAYRGGGSTVYDLKYAYNNGVQWQTEFVETGCDAGRYSSIALDALGGCHISSYHVGHSRLKYAYLTPPAPPPSSAVFRVTQGGNVFSDSAYYGQSFKSRAADVAEWVPVSEPVEPGDVLELDPDNPGHYRKSRSAYSTLVAGVVSTEPGFVLGLSSTTDDSRPETGDSVLLALLGIVPVKVTNEGGSIEPGDLLVSSSTPGYAMRWDPGSGESYNFIGKALGALIGERGIISVLLMAH